MSYHVAWWNLENLFDVENSDARTEKLERTLANELKGWDEGLVSKKVNQLSKIVKKMNEDKGPDILGICEVENRNILERLRDNVQTTVRSDHEYNMIHSDTQDKRGIDVAFIYDKNKFEVEPKKVFFHFIVKRIATREIVQVNFKSKTTGNRLILVGNHWPARVGGQLQSEPFRLIAGETLAYFNQRIQEEHGANASVVVMGDFNDEPFNRSIMEYALGTPDKDKVIRARTSPRLYNLMWPFVAKGNTGTFYYDDFNVLDQIMVSKGMVSSAGKFEIESDSLQILDYKEIQKNGKPRKFGRPSDSQGVDEQGYSDHFPISVKIVEK